jgi:hypothetical protein
MGSENIVSARTRHLRILSGRSTNSQPIQSYAIFRAENGPKSADFFAAHFRACRAAARHQDNFPSHLDPHRIDRFDAGYTMVASERVVTHLLLAVAAETCRKRPESADFFFFGPKRLLIAPRFRP